MIKIKNLIAILDNIPLLLQYVVPGYWSLFLLTYFSSKKISKTTFNVLSCVVSFILLSIVAVLRETKLFQVIDIQNTAIINSAISIIIGSIASICISIVFTSKWFNNIMTTGFHKTLNNNIWDDVIDFQNGSNLKVYIKDKDYYVIGAFRILEEKNEPWIALSGFGKFTKETNEPYKEEPSYIDDDTIFFMIRLSDVEHVEIF